MKTNIRNVYKKTRINKKLFEQQKIIEEQQAEIDELSSQKGVLE